MCRHKKNQTIQHRSLRFVHSFVRSYIYVCVHVRVWVYSTLVFDIRRSKPYNGTNKNKLYRSGYYVDLDWMLHVMYCMCSKWSKLNNSIVWRAITCRAYTFPLDAFFFKMGTINFNFGCLRYFQHLISSTSKLFGVSKIYANESIVSNVFTNTHKQMNRLQFIESFCLKFIFRLL